MTLSRRRLRLRAAWLAAPVYLALARPSLRLLAVGLMVALAGALLRAWAAGTIRKNVVLTTAGPYAYTRNPLYLGSFLIGLGLVIAGSRTELVIGYLVLFAALYGWTMRAEARRLERRFGEEYRRYAAEVPFFLPRLSPYRPGRPQRTRFRMERLLRCREYQASLGLLAGFLLLAVKMTLM